MGALSLVPEPGLGLEPRPGSRGAGAPALAEAAGLGPGPGPWAVVGAAAGAPVLGKAVQLESPVESAWVQRLEPKYGKPLSNFAFNSNLPPTSRRYQSAQVPVQIFRSGGDSKRSGLNQLPGIVLNVLPNFPESSSGRGGRGSDAAGGSLRTGSRPMLNRQTESTRLYEHSP